MHNFVTTVSWFVNFLLQLYLIKLDVAIFNKNVRTSAIPVFIIYLLVEVGQLAAFIIILS